jgi:enamine deaminase RidA (YjgF/YER057c/UK114 family)
VQIYVRAYEFDKGSWSNWMPITSGQIPNIPYSAAVQFKAVFNAATTNVTKTILETDCCYQEYKDNADIKMSSNLYMSADVIKPANSSAEAIYVSKIFDFGTKVSFGVRGFNTDTDVLYYMAYSNNKADLETNPIWYSVDSSTVITGYRYYRYKIRIPRDEVVNLVYRTLTTPVTTEYVPGAGNFKLDVDYTPHDMEYSFTQNYTNKILFDGNWHIVLQSIKDAIEPQIQAAGFSLDDIVNIEIVPKSDNADLKYDAVTLPKNETAKMIDIFNSWTRFSHWNSSTSQCIIKDFMESRNP